MAIKRTAAEAVVSVPALWQWCAVAVEPIELRPATSGGCTIGKGGHRRLYQRREHEGRARVRR